SLAGMIDPPAVIFVFLMAFVVLALRWKVQWRAAGVVCFLLGAALPVAAHVALAGSLDDLLPAELRGEQPVVPRTAVVDLQDALEPDGPTTFGGIVLEDLGKLL